MQLYITFSLFKIKLSTTTVGTVLTDVPSRTFSQSVFISFLLHVHLLKPLHLPGLALVKRSYTSCYNYVKQFQYISSSSNTVAVIVD